MLDLCTSLGIPIALDKLEGLDTAITFLGIEIDSKSQELRLPAEKLHKLLQDINMWKGKEKAKKRELLSIIGSLSFATKVVQAGRLFLRRLIDLSTKVKQLQHYVSLNAEARADFQWWIGFLPSWNGKSMFLNTTWTWSFTQLHLGLMAMEPSSKVYDLMPAGYHIRYLVPFSGKNCLLFLRQPQHGQRNSKTCR